MTSAAPINAVELSRALIRCPSVTPEDQGALDVLEATLSGLGFACHRLRFSAPNTPDVDNLYARYGTSAPNFCFAGHSDVVPVGNRAAWTVDPFGAEIIDGVLYGRGASDMKSAVAAFAAAAATVIGEGRVKGSISLLITGDEEGPAINGTVKVLDWLRQRGETIDHCLVGEPTNPLKLGQMMKIGRRGSLTGRVVVRGIQGHVGYPHLADNPVPKLVTFLQAINARKLDDGNRHFEPSNLEITTIDVGNTATNVIPAEARATFNIRFNTEQRSEDLISWLAGELLRAAGNSGEIEFERGAEPFLTAPGSFTQMMAQAIEEETGIKPELSTTGGTSDARFITRHCPVAEFGLVGQTMHKVDERALVADIEALSRIYAAILRRYFAA